MTLNPDPAWLTSDATYRQEMLDLYLHNRTGPFTIAFGGRLSFYPLPMIAPEYESLLSASVHDDSTYLRSDLHPSLLAGFKEQKRILLASFATNESAVHENVITLASIQKPLSRGYVEIASADPFDLPAVDWRTLSNPFDRSILIAGMRFVRRLLMRPELAEWNAVETSPGPDVQSDDDLLVWIREQMTPTFFHASCSCAMGPRKWGGVVDAKLKVYGVQKLRVVDASVMPMIPATHLSNSVYAIAERAADLIKSDQ
jgi:choline dehydrogenase-like flavoprotein